MSYYNGQFPPMQRQYPPMYGQHPMYRQYPCYGQFRPMYGQPPPNYGIPAWHARQNFNQIRSPSPAPLQQVVVEKPVERRKVEEISFLKPHDPLPSGVSVLLPHDPPPIEALNSIRSIGTGEEEDMYADIENQLNRLLDESN